MKTFLKGKGKINYLNGTGPNPSDPNVMTPRILNDRLVNIIVGAYMHYTIIVILLPLFCYRALSLSIGSYAYSVLHMSACGRLLGYI